MIYLPIFLGKGKIYNNKRIKTCLLARGLDIPHIRNVVNYDVARDIDTHTHRIGRTGRAGTYPLFMNTLFC